MRVIIALALVYSKQNLPQQEGNATNIAFTIRDQVIFSKKLNK